MTGSAILVFAAACAVDVAVAAAPSGGAQCAVTVRGGCQVCCVVEGRVAVEADLFKWWAPNPLAAFRGARLRLAPAPDAAHIDSCVLPPTPCGGGSAVAGSTVPPLDVTIARPAAHSHPKAREWIRRHLPMAARAHLAGGVVQSSIMARGTDGATTIDIAPAWGTTTVDINLKGGCVPSGDDNIICTPSSVALELVVCTLLAGAQRCAVVELV